jgi:hypothetical protein
MERLGIIRQVSERPRNRIFVYSAYLQLFNEGTELH